MLESNSIKDLQLSLKAYSLLYVEDNKELNTKGTALFKKIFPQVYSAHDGEEGFVLFNKHRPKIVITDISMPKIDGLKMAEEIGRIDPEIKIIITTAHDDHDYLHRSIRIGIFDYLCKPIRVEEIIDTLSRCAQALNDEFDRKIFANVNVIKSKLDLLMNGHNLIMANQACLDFFGVKSVDIFRNMFSSFGELLLEHDDFLYDHDPIKCFEKLTNNPEKLFNVKMADYDGNVHHFILDYKAIPEKEGYAVLSLNDVSDLDLLKFYDADASKNERLMRDENGALRLLEMAMRNKANIRVHNLYKGLSISNYGTITEINNKEILFQAPYGQLKALQKEKEFYLTSDLFPMAILCNRIKRVNLDHQYVAFDLCMMSSSSPIRREVIRVTTDESATVTLFHEGQKYDTECSMLDIAINSARIHFDELPAGFEINSTVTLDIVLLTLRRPFIINMSAQIYRITKDKHSFTVVCIFKLKGEAEKNLMDYIANRQMSLIKEFKDVKS